MTTFEFVGAAVLLYLLLLARSAWKQGEIGSFLRSLLFVAGLMGVIGLTVYLAIAFDQGW